MHTISDDCLVDALQKAVTFDLEINFICLLKEEIERREIVLDKELLQQIKVRKELERAS
ncbi:sporulation histidine kinase inhibitor Sda [Thalassobacillus sp. C254]|uniref:sporulation histidine kinase inhibitor Sda n=1 Tax=Thalassobacillus sp. C254 TaxID=1225341 RepID=UPI0009F8CFFB|nr:sporulation histidine kinase inhibitor Sda [Thalassobacillus sp. C254]